MHFLNRLLAPAIMLFSLLACSETKQNKITLTTGIWRAVLHYQEQDLPFSFDISHDQNGNYNIHIINSRERLLLDEVIFRGDSVIIPLHIFDASFQAKLSDDSLKGIFIKHYDKENTIPFTAVPGQNFRFRKGRETNPVTDFSGKYRVQFFNATDTTDAIGVFLQKQDSLTGTFLTSTGDYRYLQGNVVNDTMMLSAFDGNHAYLFTAVSTGNDNLQGFFYSGRTKKIPWKAFKDDKASLPDAESLTFLKPGFEKIEFTFPDPDGRQVSLNDDKFRNKVIILQLSGTWCPNCMDETRFLVPWYEQNKHRGVEVIGLAFERKDDFQYASDRVRKMIDKLNVSYEYLIAGTNDKAKASASLPMLNRIVSFPTTIFIGRDGKVKKIHTGFTGPGTGEYYDQFIEDFNETINDLLKESAPG